MADPTPNSIGPVQGDLKVQVSQIPLEIDGADDSADSETEPATDVRKSTELADEVDLDDQQPPTTAPADSDETKRTKEQEAKEWYRVYRERMKNPVKLGDMPPIELRDVPAVHAELAVRIRNLIAALSQIERPDYGFSSTMSGHAFLPVEGQNESSAFVITNHGLQSASALKELVSLGPDSLPFLLESLDDQTWPQSGRRFVPTQSVETRVNLSPYFLLSAYS